MRTLKADLDGALASLMILTENKIDYSFDIQMGKYRLTKESGANELSPRMTKKEMMYWLCAYVEGVVLGKALERDN